MANNPICANSIKEFTPTKNQKEILTLERKLEDAIVAFEKTKADAVENLKKITGNYYPELKKESKVYESIFAKIKGKTYLLSSEEAGLVNMDFWKGIKKRLIDSVISNEELSRSETTFYTQEEMQSVVDDWNTYIKTGKLPDKSSCNIDDFKFLVNKHVKRMEIIDGELVINRDRTLSEICRKGYTSGGYKDPHSNFNAGSIEHMNEKIATSVITNPSKAETTNLEKSIKKEVKDKEKSEIEEKFPNVFKRCFNNPTVRKIRALDKKTKEDISQIEEEFARIEKARTKVHKLQVEIKKKM
ncbi:MAG TPA: hypothetical protein VMW66_03175 [Elusimicrobiales bacterium]|nr:hypothetical protein [Elusimicrobiales bacterium]